MKNEETKNGNIIECIYRRYRVQSPGGMTIEIESKKPLSGRATRTLLEEDNDIGSFFENYKIIEISNVESLPEKRVPEIGRFSKSREKNINPLERLNYLLQMPGEFTRVDYQSYIQTRYRVKMSNFMGHNDIEAALALNKLEIIGKVKTRGLRQYRIIDQTEINKDQYRSILKSQK